MDPIRLAILNDYEIVVAGLAALLGPYDDIEVVEVGVQRTVRAPVDIALYDTFGAVDPDHETLQALIADQRVGAAAVFTWNFRADQVERGRREGLRGYLSKRLTADELVDALRRIRTGEVVVSAAPAGNAATSGGRRWPGQELDLTEKEADVLALITRGLDNQAIAEQLFISPNTLKTRIRNLYRKLGVDNRVQAALWGVDHGFRPDHELVWGDVRWSP